MKLRANNSCAQSQRRIRRFRAIAALAIFAVIAPTLAGEPARVSPMLMTGLGKLPLRFEPDASTPGVPERFIALGLAYHLMITPTETLVSVRKLRAPASDSQGSDLPGSTPASWSERNLRLAFVGAGPSARIAGENELPGSVNYFLGNDPARWRTGVPSFAQVRVTDLYPGISLIHYGNQQYLEYDFVVDPGVDPSVIAIQFQGADQVTIDAKGDLVLRLGADEIRQPKPLIYQNFQGTRKEIAGGYLMSDSQTVKFEIGPYDRRLPLVIDPVLSYSIYYGGGGLDAAWGVAVDTNGFVYVAGESMGGLPTTAGTLTNPYQGARSHGDAFVAKFNNDASQVIYLAYVGGNLGDVARSLAVDNGGNAYITGWTESADFPRKSAIFNTISGIPYPVVGIYPTDAFVTKLGPLGTNLIYSTYLGGGWADAGFGIAVDPTGSAYVTGYTESTNFPTVNVSGGFTNFGLYKDAFVTKFGPAGTNLIYSMYLGGAKFDVGNDIAADAAGRAYVTGHTDSENFPTTTNAPQQLLAGGKDAFVTVLGPNGTNLFSTYWGGAGDNAGYGLALDSAANIYLTGSTKEDSGFPVSPGGINPGGVFRSANTGADWNAASIGLQSVVVYALAVDPITPTRVYAGTSRGVAQSEDGGATWTKIPFRYTTTNGGIAKPIDVGSVLSLAIDPVGWTNVYAGTGQGVFKVVLDAGTNSYFISRLDLITTRALAIDPATPTTLYAGGNAGVYRSTDGATNWSAVNNGLGNIDVRALAVNPLAPTTVYAATAGGVYRTTTSGDFWFGFNFGLTNSLAFALAIDPVTPATVYVGTEDGVFKSVNAGTNWSAMNVGLTTTNALTRVAALAIDPLTPTTLYAGTPRGLFKSIDGGASWNAINNGLPVLPILAVQLNPQSPNKLYAGTSGTSVFGREDAFLTKLGFNGFSFDLGFSVVLGGSLDDKGWDVTVDATGRAHLIGTTASKNFPTTNTFGFLSASNAGLDDVFVSELSSVGQSLINSAYLGGSAVDSGYGIAVDAAGDVYVVGQTASDNFPTRAALQDRYRGSGDGFLAKISSANIQLVLDIRSVSNAVQLTWTALASEFKLQSKTNLVGTNVWANVPGTPVRTNATLTVSLPATNAAQFFRLSNP